MSKSQEPKIERQSLSNRVVHALIASSMFALFFTGFGQMPVYKRYMLTEVPGFAWTGDYHITFWLHMFFGVILTAVVFYHIVYHWMRKEFDIVPKKGDTQASLHIMKAMIKGEKEPPSEKYLPEQRLAYAFIGFWTIVMIVTGILKAIKNVNGIEFSLDTLFWLAQIHNLGFFMLIIGVIAHLGAFAIKANRKLLPGILYGKVSACYTKFRHSLWKEGVQKSEKSIKKSGKECKEE